MLTTRVCDFAELHPPIYDYISATVLADAPVQYCIQAREDETGKPPKYYAYVLTQSKLTWASDAHVASLRRFLP